MARRTATRQGVIAGAAEPGTGAVGPVTPARAASALQSRVEGTGLAGHATDVGVQPAGALASALDRVGDRWSLLLVADLLDGPRRFNDLLARLPGLAPNTLTDRLRRLEREGILVARPYSSRPPRMEYALTAEARDLAGALRLLADWGAHRAGGDGTAHQPIRHATCGTPLEARWYCPTCTVMVEDSAVDELRRL